MTNREIINNISNKDMGVKIFNAITEIQNKYHNHSSFEICDRFIDWLSQEVELTADEMFEGLNYCKMCEDKFKIGYETFCDGDSRGRVTIYKKDKSYAITLKDDYFRISPELDKAIHKKIEEIKNENRN